MKRLCRPSPVLSVSALQENIRMPLSSLRIASQLRTRDLFKDPRAAWAQGQASERAARQTCISGSVTEPTLQPTTAESLTTRGREWFKPHPGKGAGSGKGTGRRADWEEEKNLLRERGSHLGFFRFSRRGRMFDCIRQHG